MSGGGMKDMMGMMKQARDMQQKMQEAQERLEAMEIAGRSGAGAVEVIVNGRGAAKRVTVSPELFREDDKAVLEDLLVAAFNDARTKAEDAAQKAMAEAMGPLGALGGMFGG
jgi:hypothetical protein